MNMEYKEMRQIPKELGGDMKKMRTGLTLVATMVIFGLIGMIGAAAASSAGSVNGISVMSIAVIGIFGPLIIIGAVAYIRWSAKKSGPFDGRFVKALNAGIVHRMTAVNTRYAFTYAAIATSPRKFIVAYRQM